MKSFKRTLRRNRTLIISSTLCIGLVASLLLFRLGTLVPGLSAKEVVAATQPVGWHGIFHDPLYLPLKLVRSVIFFILPEHGASITRLANVLFGALSIGMFAALVRLWHGPRIATFMTAIFVCNAWVLHVSRLASFDVLYLWGMLVLVSISVGLQRYSQKRAVVYASLLAWGSLLYIPGFIWLVLFVAVLKRRQLQAIWTQATAIRTKLLFALSLLIWLPLLIIHLRRPGQLALWLGLPEHLASVSELAKQFVGVFVHLFLRGPAYPDVWLGRSPVLDMATLILCLLGLYFYASHHRASRSHLLGGLFAISVILVTLGGPVGLSVLLPLAILGAATGMTYLLHEWLQTFPNNPVARAIGISMIALLVAVSCTYNLRSYFVAWPHALDTHAAFRNQP